MLADNNRWGVAQVSYGMGTLARTRGDAEMAVRYFADAMEIFRELDARPEIARCQAGIGWIAVTSGDYDQAADSLAEALRLNQIGGQRLGIARGLEAFAALAAARQQPERAARLAGAACQLRESLGHGTGIGPRMIGWGEIAPLDVKPTTVVQHWTNDSASLHPPRGGKIVATSARSDQQHRRVAGSADDGEDGQTQQEQTDAAVADPSQNKATHQPVSRTSSHGPV